MTEYPPTPTDDLSRKQRAHQATITGLARLEKALGHDRFLEVCRWADRSITVARHGLRAYAIALTVVLVLIGNILLGVTVWSLVVGNRLTLYLAIAFILWVALAIYLVARNGRVVLGLKHTAQLRDQLLGAVDVSRLRDDGLAVIFGDETTKGVKAKAKQVWVFYRFLDSSVDEFIHLPSVHPFLPHVRWWTRAWTIIILVAAILLLILNVVANIAWA